MKRVGVVLVAAAVGAAAGAHLRSHRSLGQPGATVERDPSNSSLLQGALDSEAELVKQVVVGTLGLPEAMKHVDERMSVQDAERRLEKKLPEDVAALLKASKKTKAVSGLDEESLQKARVILNNMVQASFVELDKVIIDCKSFENMNRVTFGQVTTDLARMGSELAEAEELITENYNCINRQAEEYKSVQTTLNNERSSYERVKAENEAEMTMKQNDLAVFDFIMDLTKCAGGNSFLQQADNASAPVRLCGVQDGLELHFTDPKVQAKFDKIVTPEAKRAIDAALGLAFASRGKVSARVSRNTEEPSSTVSTTASTSSYVPVSTEGVVEGPPKSVMWKKCTDGKPDCALLHDTMSLQWGKFKDLVDELQAEMERNEGQWEALREDLNSQMNTINGMQSQCQTGFNEATGKKNTLTDESDGKTRQSHDLTHHYEQTMAECHSKVEELLFTDVCAVRKVRNELMTSSTTSPPDKVIDCHISDWVADVCSVRCDDTCPRKVGGVVDPFACGGMQKLHRSVVVQANEFGIPCPTLETETRCGQFKCPADCMMSEWSGWSKCTKDCEGGSRQRTRSILQRPVNGGASCNSPVDTEPCNTGSCTRDCQLDDWTSFSPCSMACNPGGMPGFKERVRKVLVPVRGEGKCPSADGSARYDKQTCNDHACRGDEVCVARQDLIIAIDASGSLRESGFEIERDFAANLTGSYRSMYYGQEAAHIGVILFGNGARTEDGSIAPAIKVVGLTQDFAQVKSKIEATTWQKGFTNMAQAFVLADTMLQQGGRGDAQSAMLVLSDGKYSFAFETENAVKTLKDKGTMIYMAPISDRGGAWQEQLKEWASQPWETNYELLDGMELVKHNMALMSSRIVAKFCPQAISPKNLQDDANRKGYTLIHQGGVPNAACGEKKDMGVVAAIEDCAKLASESGGHKAFAITEPSLYRDGQQHCLSFGINVTPDLWSQWVVDRTDIQCPGGAWEANPEYDVYAIMPIGV